MRRLTSTHKADDQPSEEGAISVLVALLLVVLLGFAALAIDVGLLYTERAELQNGADAGALGIAQVCAKTPADPDCSESIASTSLAKELANANSRDSVSRVSRVDLDRDVGKVTVTTGSEESDGSHNVALFFAGLIGTSGAEVGATASAQWGSPVRGTTVFPITFSECEINMDNEEPQIIDFLKKADASPACPGGPPGGFAKLDSGTGGCGADVDLTKASAGSQPGNEPKFDCGPLLESWKTEIGDGDDVYPRGIFPTFSSVAGVSGSGSGATYNLKAFAAFEIYGWQFKQGGSHEVSFRHNYYPGIDCGNAICLIGKFVEYVALDADFDIGPPGGAGPYIVKLTA